MYCYQKRYLTDVEPQDYTDTPKFKIPEYTAVGMPYLVHALAKYTIYETRLSPVFALN